MPKSNSPARRNFVYQAALLLVAIIWGGGFPFSQMALDSGLTPFGVMLGRFTIATLLFGLLFGRSILRNFQPGQLKGCLVIGILLFSAFLTQIIGLQLSSPSNNAFITASNVIMVPFLWWLFAKQRPPKIMFPASFLSLVGVSILSVNFTGGLSVAIGDVFTLLSAFLFASQIVATGLLARTIDPRVLVFTQFLVAGLLSLAAFLVFDGNFSVFGQAKSLLSVSYLGILSTGLCFLLQTIAQKHVHSAKAAILLSTEALFGALFSVLAGYDELSPQMVLGGGIVMCSVLLPEIYMQHAETIKKKG